MRILFLLSGENPELAKEEVSSLIAGRAVEDGNRILVLEAKGCPAVKRLAFTKKAYRLLFTSSVENLEEALKGFKWYSVYKKSFGLRVVNLSERRLDPAKLAGIIYGKLRQPRVDLEKAATMIELVITPEKAYGCLLIWENKEDFKARRAHLRPGFLPTSMHPKLARLMVNLSGSKTSILDPFCGTGGILIEAGLMNLKAKGSDLDSKALHLCELNLKHYRIRGCALSKRDACDLPKADYIVTDLPYGRSSRIMVADAPKDRQKLLYKRYFKALKKSLRKRAVVSCESSSGCESIAKAAGLEIIRYFDIYIHKSLTKRILIVGP